MGQNGLTKVHALASQRRGAGAALFQACERHLGRPPKSISSFYGWSLLAMDRAVLRAA